MSQKFIASLCLISLLTLVGVARANEPLKSDAPSVMTCPKGVPDETTCYSGKDDNGAFYVIAKPKNWNNMLVVTAHGGPSPFGDEKLLTSVALLERFSFIVREGYGWAGSSFRRGGFGVRMAAEDSENARRIFIKAFGQPKRTVIHGQSYGAGVAAKVAELYAVKPDGSRNYDAVLMTSGSPAGRASTCHVLTCARCINTIVRIIRDRTNRNTRSGWVCPPTPSSRLKIWRAD